MISVLLPYRPDHGQRDRLFAHVTAKWRETPDVELCVGLDNASPIFNTARAFNHAFDQSTGDVVCTYGADHLPDPDKVHAARQLLEHHEWAPLYAHTAGYSQADTDAILDGADPDQFEYAEIFDFCTGVLALRRNTWIDVAGMDERFDRGWGAEDTAFRCALQTLWPDAPEPTGTLRHLWHAPAPRTGFAAHATLIETEYVPAIGDPDAMRAVLRRAREARDAVA